MMMPEEIRRQIKDELWEKLDELCWSTMSDADHSNYYEIWTKAPNIGGRLGHFMDPRDVRVYIKDTLVKDYARERLNQSLQPVLKLFAIERGVIVERKFIKPHGIQLADGRVICWGNSRDWKHLLLAAFERQYRSGRSADSYVAILEAGKIQDRDTQTLIQEVGDRLGIYQIIWVE